MSGNVFVSPFNPVQQAGVRAKNPPDLTIANRAPTTKDFGHFPGSLWLFIGNSYWGMLNNHIAGVPAGQWVLFGAGGSPLTNINGIAPIAGTINLVANQVVPGVPDGIVITAPSTQGPANTIGFGVLVDGVTITKNGAGQLVASGAAAAVTQFTIDSGVTNPVSPIAGNMNLQGNQPGHRGAIDFAGGPAGQIYARVLPDNITLDINPVTNLLEAKGKLEFTLHTVGAAMAVTADIPIPDNEATSVYVLFTVANNDPAAPSLAASDIAQGVARVAGGMVTVVNGDFIDVSVLEEAALMGIDFNLIAGVGPSTVKIQVVGVLGQNLDWHASVTLSSTP